MALNADIVGSHIIELARVHDVLARGMRRVRSTRTVAALTTYVPLGHGICSDVEVHRVAAVAERAGRTLHVVRGVKRGPPVCPVPDEVWQPLLVRDIPLRRKYKIIVAGFGEVSLLPFAAVHQRDVLRFESYKRVGFGEIRQNGIRILAGIANDVSHARLFPAFVYRRMACFAGRGSCVSRDWFGEGWACAVAARTKANPHTIGMCR